MNVGRQASKEGIESLKLLKEKKVAGVIHEALGPVIGKTAN
jgi:hypothetical protein